MITEAVPIAVQNAKRVVVQVGHGRGFIVSAGDERYIVTAAHCLPRWRYPTPYLGNGAALLFPKIIGPLGSKRPRRTISAELCFLSLVDDVAVLAEPDGQIEELEVEYSQYQDFTMQATVIGPSPTVPGPPKWSLDETFSLKAVPTAEQTPAWLLSLEGAWHRCTVQNNIGRFLTVRQGHQIIKPGMSGSCIADDSGAAIGIVATGTGSGANNFQPSLTDCLPPWLLRKLDHGSPAQNAFTDPAPASAFPSAVFCGRG